MKASDVKLGGTYLLKRRGQTVEVVITSSLPNAEGKHVEWQGLNVRTNRLIWIRSTQARSLHEKPEATKG
jgi:hypothetical protein